MITRIAAFCSVVLLPSCLLAVKTDRVIFDDYPALEGGIFENTSLSHLGELLLAPKLEKSVTLDDAKTIWDAVYDGESLFVGTGNQGTVYRLDGSGELSVYFESGQLFVRALAIGPDGALYVATSPEGSVYRIVEGQRPEIYFDPEETYIWDMLFDAEGNLFVATGNAANIYKVPADYQAEGSLEPFFESDREHVHVLAFDGQKLLAGTSPEAMIYAIDEAGEGRILASGYGEEVTALYPGADGTLYFSAYKGQQSQGGSSGDKPSSAVQAAVQAAMNAQNGNSSGAQASQDGGSLYRLEPTGFVEPFSAFPGANVFTFLAREEKAWIAGTNVDGMLYAFDGESSWSLLHKLKDGGQVSALLPGSGEEVFVLTSNPAAVYTLGQKAEQGSYTADVYDATRPVRWGRLRAFSLPQDAELEWETRTGNSKSPGDDWSDWEAVEEGGQILSPVGRYIQWRVDMADSDALLASTEVYFQYRNNAPQVQLINIVPLGIEVITVKGQQPPLNIKQLLGNNGFSGNVEMPEPKERQQLFVTGQHGFLTAGWKAQDPNGDELRYALAIRRIEGDPAWVTLAENLSEPVFSFNTQGYEPGYYRVRVQASDAPSNNAETARIGEKESHPILIDNEAPKLDGSYVVDGKRVELTVSANDRHAVIESASYVLDGAEAVLPLPEDSLFDSQSEHFVLRFENLKPGTHSFVMTARDALGNEGTYQAVFNIE